MSLRRLAILGSSGSIGRSALEVIRKHPGRLSILALTAHSNDQLLEEQYHEFRPPYLCLVDSTAAARLRQKLHKEPVTVLEGEADLTRLAAQSDVDIVLNAVVGAAGLKASYEAVTAGKQLALANKESLVAGGPLFADVCRKEPPQILPVDSEHSAIWQALRAGKRSEVRQIILTASGGPFRTWTSEQIAAVTVEQALAHPTWKMGRKITVDSATLANKGLEVLEAVVLFGLEPRQIKVVVHPQSIVHSLVEFVDSAVIAQLSEPDMSLPIAYALFWPERLEQEFGRMDWTQSRHLEFEAPDFERFPALKLAYEAAETGGTAPAIFNAANEVAVAAFLDRTIRFTEIADIIGKTLDRVEVELKPGLEEIMDADSKARQTASKMKSGAIC
jgi:1-deoxy-D-xylulose-5-phosphate reductoisomerase